MLAWSFAPPVSRNHRVHLPRQRRTFRAAQIRLLVLGESSEQKDRNVTPAEEIDHPCSPALASSAKPEPYLPDAASARNEHPAFRILCDHMNERIALLWSEQPLGICDEGRRLDNRVRAWHLRQCRITFKAVVCHTSPRQHAPAL